MRVLFGTSTGAAVLAACGPGNKESGVPTPPAAPRTTVEAPPLKVPEVGQGPDEAPTASPKVEPEAPKVPNDIKFNYSEQVPEEDRQVVRDGSNMARDYFYEELGVSLPFPPEVNVVFQPEQPWSGVTNYPRVRINVGNPNWKTRTPNSKDELVSHEYFHLLQAHESKQTLQSSALPWLMEGSAVLASYYALVNKRGVNLDAYMNNAFNLLRARRVGQLDTIKYGDPGSPDHAPNYSMGTVACDFLTRDKGGIGQIMEYFKNIPRFGSWEAAFEPTFGESLGNFYERFSKYRVTKSI